MKKLLTLLLFTYTASFSQDIPLHADQFTDSDSVSRLMYFGSKKPLQGFLVVTKTDNISHVYSNIYGYAGQLLLTTTDSLVGRTIGIDKQSITIYDDNPVPHAMKYFNSNISYTSPTDIPSVAYVKSLILMKLATKTTLPTASPAGQMIFVTNATGGKCPAYSDGTNWRRFSDNSIIN